MVGRFAAGCRPSTWTGTQPSDSRLGARSAGTSTTKGMAATRWWPSLAVRWASSTGSPLYPSTIPCVEPRVCGATVRCGVSAKNEVWGATFGLVLRLVRTSTQGTPGGWTSVFHSWEKVQIPFPQTWPTLGIGVHRLCALVEDAAKDMHVTLGEAEGRTTNLNQRRSVYVGFRPRGYPMTLPNAVLGGSGVCAGVRKRPSEDETVRGTQL